MRVTKENEAKCFGRLNACASEHIGAPYTNLNTRCLFIIDFGVMNHEENSFHSY